MKKEVVEMKQSREIKILYLDKEVAFIAEDTGCSLEQVNIFAELEDD